MYAKAMPAKELGLHVDSEAALLEELKAVSNRHTAERYASSDATAAAAKVPTTTTTITTSFLQQAPEDQQLNQYWYSQNTINTLRDAILEGATSLDKDAPRVAFLSTPSLFFAFDEAERRHFHLFDFDDSKAWSSDARYVYFDYNHPLGFDESLRNSFDVVVIDPPFITREVWEKYAQTTEALATATSPSPPLVLATTVHENAPLMKELFDATPTAFQPSIPNLVYQYACFTNFPCDRLAQPNEEITSDQSSAAKPY